jgi:hypothetical protein
MYLYFRISGRNGVLMPDVHVIGKYARMREVRSLTLSNVTSSYSQSTSTLI